MIVYWKKMFAACSDATYLKYKLFALNTDHMLTCVSCGIIHPGIKKSGFLQLI